jgi:membrane-associated phospholipid phosphatase
MIHPGWFDRHLLAFDAALFGNQPALLLVGVIHPGLTEVMQAFYFSYFLLLPIVGGYFYHRRMWREFDHLMTAVTLGYVTSYVVFYLFPIEGPFHTIPSLAVVELRGGPFTALMAGIERYGRVHGGAFPSAHVVGSLVPVLVAWRHAGRLACWLAPCAVGVALATVYGRYHYAADVLAGAVVAVAVCWIVTRRGRSVPDGNGVDWREPAPYNRHPCR